VWAKVEETPLLMQEDAAGFGRQAVFYPDLVGSGPLVTPEKPTGRGFRVLHPEVEGIKSVIYRQPILIREAAGLHVDERFAFDDPIFDENGYLVIRIPDGRILPVRCGAMRRISLGGDLRYTFQDLARAADSVLENSPPSVTGLLPPDTLAVKEPIVRWVMAVFDLAWAEVPGSPLRISTPKSLEGKGTLAEIQRGREPPASSDPGTSVPVPDRSVMPTWSATIADVARASGYAIDILLNVLSGTRTGQAAQLGKAGDQLNEARFLPKREVQKIFGMTDKMITGFLARHPKIETARPLTRRGQPHPRRLNVNVIDFIAAIRQDDFYANNPVVQEKIQRNLQKAKVNKALMDACTALLVPGHRQRK
jgi:hypothetical protein